MAAARDEGTFPTPGRINDHQLETWFAHHAPFGDQAYRYGAIRQAGRALATVIRDSCPPSADTTAAIRKVREAVFTANAAIACGE